MTKNGAETPLATLIVAGTEQVAAVGAPVHVNATVPLNPAVSCKLYVAVCPAEMLAERLPPVAGAIVSSLSALPRTATVCGEFGASSAIVRVAVRTPVADGVNVSPTVHAVFTGYAEAVHPLLMLKSPALLPLSATEEKCKAAPPELVTVIFCGGLVVPTATPPNETAVEERVTEGAAVPVPVSWTVCGEFGASSVIVSVAVRTPVADGVNVSATMHVAPAAYDVAVHPLFMPKSPAFVPVTCIEEMCNAAVPEFAIVVVCGALAEPCPVVAKEIACGVIVTAGLATGGPAPVPVT